MRQVWGYLKPRGMIDLAAEMHWLEGPQQLNLTVRAEPSSDLTSVEPVQFPYRLEKLQGVFTYCNGRVTLGHFKAEHGAMKIAAAGQCDFLPDGGWRLRLDGLSVDRLRADRELMQALPARLRKALEELKPDGSFSLRGGFELARGGGPDDPVRSQWDLALGLQQAGLDCGLRLENIQGSVTLAGGYDGRNFHCGGELALDSLTCKDCQLTQVMGPLWIDDKQVLLGSLADRRQRETSPRPRPPRPFRTLTGAIYGGSAYGDAWVALGPQPRYGVRAGLANGRLCRWAQENLVGRQNLQGRVLASVDLQGAGRTCNTLSGRGTVQIRDANVYELPAMISLLKLLSIRPPDANAFSKSDIAFHVQGEHIYFDRLDFTGDAISLLGKGEMNLQQEIRLAFTAIVGRGDLRIPLVHELFTGASQQSMLIHVDGTLQNPEMHKEAFPGVNQALQKGFGMRE